MFADACPSPDYLQTSPLRAVVLVVVDISDFDGSLPRTALQALLPRDIETGGLRTPQDTDLVIAVNKVLHRGRRLFHIAAALDSQADQVPGLTAAGRSDALRSNAFKA